MESKRFNWISSRISNCELRASSPHDRHVKSRKMRSRNRAFGPAKEEEEKKSLKKSFLSSDDADEVSLRQKNRKHTKNRRNCIAVFQAHLKAKRRENFAIRRQFMREIFRPRRCKTRNESSRKIRALSSVVAVAGLARLFMLRSLIPRIAKDQLPRFICSSSVNNFISQLWSRVAAIVCHANFAGLGIQWLLRRAHHFAVVWHFDAN